MQNEDDEETKFEDEMEEFMRLDTNIEEQSTNYDQLC